MVSLRGRFFREFLRRKGNFNPIRHPDAVSIIRNLYQINVEEKPLKGFSVCREQTLGGTPYERIFEDGKGETGKLVLYFHGGAYISPLVSVYRQAAPEVCHAGNCEVILLDYRTAPQHTFPAQLDDALDLWEELTERQGYLPENILIGGDSAGSNLTLALMLKLRDEQRPLPCAAFCISVWADMTLSGESYMQNYSRDVMFGEKGVQPSEESRVAFMQSDIFCFTGDADRTNPYVSPVYGEYYGFPPMLFTVGSHEMLLSDTLTIVEKLRREGCEVECDVKEGMFHIYPLYAKYIPESLDSHKRIMSFISRKLNT